MNAKNKISRSVLKVNCTYTIEDTVRFASLRFISTLLHQALPDPSSNRQVKEASHPPKKYPSIQKKHTHELLLLAYLTYLPTHLPISNEQEPKHDPIALLFSSLLFPSPSPSPPTTQIIPNQTNPPKTIMPPPLASRNLLICFDAFGTLFTPKLPIAKQYGNVARSFGLTGSFTDEDVGRAFKVGEADSFFSRFFF